MISLSEVQVKKNNEHKSARYRYDSYNVVVDMLKNMNNSLYNIKGGLPLAILYHQFN